MQIFILITKIRLTPEHNTKNIILDTPIWFNSNSFQTLAEWVVSSFEKTIWSKFLQNRKNPPKNSSSFEMLDFKITLKYKRNLVDFWKGLDKNKKKKVYKFA